MTSAQQRAALQRQIWQIANDVRGAVDGWDFKQYVLGTLFYRFIGENFASYIEGGDDSIQYAKLSDGVITADIKDDAIKTKGYFIYPSQSFSRVAASAHSNESLNTGLAAIFAVIESSASGYPSEHDIKGLFADFDTTGNRLGNTVKDKNARLAAVPKGVAGLDFGGFAARHIDLFGDACEFLISNYAANARHSALHGQILEETDEPGVRTTWDHDERGNRTEVTDANGHITRYGYDLTGNVTQLTDAAGQLVARIDPWTIAPHKPGTRPATGGEGRRQREQG